MCFVVCHSITVDHTDYDQYIIAVRHRLGIHQRFSGYQVLIVVQPITMEQASSPSSPTTINATFPGEMHQIADAAGAVLEAVINEVQSHIKAFNKHNASAWKSFKAFLSAVDWTVRC